MEKLATLLLKIKNPAILMGSLYAVAFILLLPLTLERTGGTLDLAGTLFLSLIAALATHIALNWFYYLAVIFPAVMAAVSFVSGMLIWIFAPALTLLVLILSMGTGEVWVAPITEIITRLGQAGMIIGGGFWWLTQKLGRVKYQALVVYLVALGILGICMGIIQPCTAFVSLLVWAVIYLKVQGEERLGDLRVVFQIVASAMVLAGINAIHVAPEGRWLGASLAGGYGFGIPSWAVAYRWILGVCGWGVIWFPGRVIKLLPGAWQERLQRTIVWVQKEGAGFLKVHSVD